MIFSAVRQAYERGGVAEARAEHARLAAAYPGFASLGPPRGPEEPR